MRKLKVAKKALELHEKSLGPLLHSFLTISCLPAVALPSTLGHRAVAAEREARWRRPGLAALLKTLAECEDPDGCTSDPRTEYFADLSAVTDLNHLYGTVESNVTPLVVPTGLKM
jgi:hypothetical protein